MTDSEIINGAVRRYAHDDQGVEDAATHYVAEGRFLLALGGGDDADHAPSLPTIGTIIRLRMLVVVDALSVSEVRPV